MSELSEKILVENSWIIREDITCSKKVIMYLDIMEKRAKAEGAKEEQKKFIDACLKSIKEKP